MGFTRLQDLIIYSQVQENFYFNSDRCSQSPTIVANLLDTNPGLKSLEINVSQYEYETDQLSILVLMAIERHSRLKKLSWYFPADYCTYEFCQALLVVCFTRKIEELKVKIRDFQYYFCSECDESCSCVLPDSYYFRWGALDQNLEGDSEFEQFKKKCLEIWIETMGPYSFQKLILPEQFIDFYTILLKYCPHLIEVGFEFWDDGHTLDYELMAQNPKLSTLDLRNVGDNFDYEIVLSRIKNLGTVRLNEITPRHLCEPIKTLLQSSRDSLKVLELHLSVIVTAVTVIATEVLFIVEKFGNLKEIDLEIIKIYIQNGDKMDQGDDDNRWAKTGSRFFSPGSDLSLFEDCIVQDWDSATLYRSHLPMNVWWYRWMEAKCLVQEISKLYMDFENRANGVKLRPIFIQFQLSIKSFMSLRELDDYIHETGVWRGVERRALTAEDARQMMEAERNDPEAHVERVKDWVRVWTPAGKRCS